MLRRNIFKGLLASLAGAAAARSATAQSPQRLKVAYHLTEADRAGFVLGNIRNHYDGTQGNVEIVLVVHGPALAAFKSAGASATIANRFTGLIKDGLKAQACGNTLLSMSLTPADLLSGFAVVDEGGVVRLAQLQSEGYAYLRP